MKKTAYTAEDQSDIIKRMLEEAAQCVIISDPDGDGDVVLYEVYIVEAEETSYVYWKRRR